MAVMAKAAVWASGSEAPARRRASSRNSGSGGSGGENWPSGVERLFEKTVLLVFSNSQC